MSDDKKNTTTKAVSGLKRWGEIAASSEPIDEKERWNQLGSDDFIPIPNIAAMQKMIELQNDLEGYSTNCPTVDDIIDISKEVTAVRRDILKYVGYMFKEGEGDAEAQKQLAGVFTDLVAWHHTKMAQLLTAISECSRK